MFFPNAFLGFRDCLDGACSIRCWAAEVKAWTPYRRNGGPGTVSEPMTVASLQTIVPSAPEFKDTGHTEWPDGRVHHSGFTTTMAPNTLVAHSVAGNILDVDYNSWQEGRNGNTGSSTYAAVTSRSYHEGLVHASRIDGSVTSITESIDLCFGVQWVLERGEKSSQAIDSGASTLKTRLDATSARLAVRHSSCRMLGRKWLHLNPPWTLVASPKPCRLSRVSFFYGISQWSFLILEAVAYAQTSTLLSPPAMCHGEICDPLIPSNSKHNSRSSEPRD